jgi:hypothetical protein
VTRFGPSDQETLEGVGASLIHFFVQFISHAHAAKQEQPTQSK